MVSASHTADPIKTGARIMHKKQTTGKHLDAVHCYVF